MTREQIAKITKECKRYGTDIICFADVKTEEVEWLAEPLIPMNKLTTIFGEPGIGKTHLVLKIAAAVSTGKRLPMKKDKEPIFGNVIFQSAEDGLGDTIKPRLEKMRADVSNVFIIDDSADLLTLIDPRLEVAIRVAKPRLVIIDPIQTYMGTDMNRAEVVRPIMAHLDNLAKKNKCAIVLVGHLNKSAKGNIMHRPLGSIDIVAASRSSLLVTKMQGMEHKRLITPIKANLARVEQAVVFEVSSEKGIEWLGLTDLNGTASTGDGAGKKCTDSIMELMSKSGNNIPANEAMSALTQLGFSASTIGRAKRNLGIKSRKGEGGAFDWTL